MKYAKADLIALVDQRIKGWGDYTAALEAKKKADRDKEFSAWEAKHKQKALDALAQGVRNIRAGKQSRIVSDRYNSRANIVEPPAPYEAPGHACNTTVSQLQDLRTLLVNMTDDEVTTAGLERIGIRSLGSLLRQPC